MVNTHLLHGLLDSMYGPNWKIAEEAEKEKAAWHKKKRDAVASMHVEDLDVLSERLDEIKPEKKEHHKVAADWGPERVGTKPGTRIRFVRG